MGVGVGHRLEVDGRVVFEFRHPSIGVGDLGDIADAGLDIFRHVWHDLNAQKNGRLGQPQHGTDIWGRGDSDADALYGVHCKGKDAAYGGSITEGKLRHEIEKAKSLTPPLSQDVERWKNCGFTSCPSPGSYFCQTACDPNGIANPTSLSRLMRMPVGSPFLLLASKSSRRRFKIADQLRVVPTHTRTLETIRR
jgi:hypothetical protein